MTEFRLHHLTWPQAQERLAEARVGIIPLGATEQHGPHLRMGTDYRVAERLAEETVVAADGLAVMTPPLPIGFSPHHAAFPGTLTARASTLQVLLHDVIDSLASHGLRRFLIMNGHGGNLAFLPAFLAEVRAETPYQLAVVHWSMMGRDVVQRAATTEVYGHACEVETGVALAIAPELVNEAELGGPAPVQSPAHELLQGQAIPERAVGAFMPRGFAEVTPNGALGNPSTADATIGWEIVEAVRDRTVEFIRHMASTERDESEPTPVAGWPHVS